MPHYQPDQGLANLAADIIRKDRPQLSVLAIAFVFRDEAPVSDGKVKAGMCVRIDDRNWTLHKQDFLIEIAKDIWDQANPQFQRALMDHELGHCGIRYDDETGAPAIDENTGRIKTYCRQHDIEEFADVLQRHGDYHEGLRTFIAAFAKHRIDAKAKKKTEAAEAAAEAAEES
jgi:hypothetical protein